MNEKAIRFKPLKTDLHITLGYSVGECACAVLSVED